MSLISEVKAKQEQSYDSIVSQVQAQYRDSNIKTLLQGIADIKKKYILKALQSMILDNFSLNTAKGDGLDLWGFLLGLNRYILIDEVSGLAYKMQDDEFRTILMCLYQKSFINANIESVNDFANSVLGDFAEVAVADSTDMKYQIFTFNKRLPNWLTFCLQNKDILPRPACVGVKVQESVYNWFGFAPDDYDALTAPETYNARVEWFKNHIGNFDNSIFKDITSYEDYLKRVEWFKANIGNFDNSIFEKIDSGEFVFGFAPERE